MEYLLLGVVAWLVFRKEAPHDVQDDIDAIDHSFAPDPIGPYPDDVEDGVADPGFDPFAPRDSDYFGLPPGEDPTRSAIVGERKAIP